MADKRDTPEAPEQADKGPRRKKRAAPTIDLTAREVESAPFDRPQPDPPPRQTAVQPEPDPTPQPPPTTPHEPARRAGAGIYAAAIAAAVTSAAFVCVVFALLWRFDLLPGRPAASDNAQIAVLRKQVQDLQSRPAPAADNQAIDALRQRVVTMEHDIANLPPGDKTVAERLAAADSAMKALGIALTALNHRSDDVAAKATQAQERAAAAEKAIGDLRTSVQDAAKNAAAIAPGELDALQKRIAALEQSAKATRDDIAKTSYVDQPARLALSAAALHDAVVRGAPFAAELAQAKSLGAADAALAPLASFAATGVPGAQTLAHDLGELLPAVLKAANAQAPSGGFLERLQANAGNLVRIRPIDAPPGDDASAVLARIEIDAAKADIAAALVDLAKLPERARAPAAAWIGKAKAREAALAAVRRIAADTARALATPAAP